MPERDGRYDFRNGVWWGRLLLSPTGCGVVLKFRVQSSCSAC